MSEQAVTELVRIDRVRFNDFVMFLLAANIVQGLSVMDELLERIRIVGKEDKIQIGELLKGALDHSFGTSKIALIEWMNIWLDRFALIVVTFLPVIFYDFGRPLEPLVIVLHTVH